MSFYLADELEIWINRYSMKAGADAVKNKKPEDVEPKAGKIRCMMHLALSANVQGIIYYWLPKDRYDMRRHSPIQWAETVVCARHAAAMGRGNHETTVTNNKTWSGRWPQPKLLVVSGG